MIGKVGRDSVECYSGIRYLQLPGAVFDVNFYIFALRYFTLTELNLTISLMAQYRARAHIAFLWSLEEHLASNNRPKFNGLSGGSSMP